MKKEIFCNATKDHDESHDQEDKVKEGFMNFVSKYLVRSKKQIEDKGDGKIEQGDQIVEEANSVNFDQER